MESHSLSNNHKRSLKDNVERGERFFRAFLLSLGVFMILLVSSVLLTLVLNSLPSIKEFGLSFFTGATWNPVNGKFGALPFLMGTLLTSILSLLISVPFSLSISILISDYIKGGLLSSILQIFTELIAGIPSVVIGLWGLFVLVPLVRKLETKIGITPYGVGIFTASIILAIMIIPYSASIGREVLSLVPKEIKEGGFSLGATKFEVIKNISLPYAKSGILAGFLLSFGRAFGETMAVTMVIGNSNKIPKSIFMPGNTMASVIANEFAEATTKLYISSLIEMALLLFLVSTVINIFGRYVIKRLSNEETEGKNLS
ncbi:MAG: phosphate ABC transporter permease subunit PstC [Caldiserica bacterium]|nr:MAG: phosphate ABC transporter permease subunit PstC [Caldisericota bacterium]